MNRLVLVGNGFDLAHGMKTGYNDFILWYIKQCFIAAYDDNGYSDQLLKITNTPYLDRFHFTKERLIDSIDQCYKVGRFNDLKNNTWFSNAPNSQISNPFQLTIKSKLLDILLPNCTYTNWVDIENEYYELLKKALKEKQIGDREKELRDSKEKKLKDINESLSFIIETLKIYLTNLPKPYVIKDYMKMLTSKIKSSDVLDVSITVEEEPQTTLLLNFNYTDTIKQYRDWFGPQSTRPIPEINYIHGQIDDDYNKMIFGFGDELDESYVEIEKEKAKGYFEYIKSFWYFRTSNYRNLITFIDSQDYQVYIWGHSCGLSDRTMLNTIFEHNNCKSIKIFYHGNEEKNNYVSLTHEISRHFKDKGIMRKKILPFDKSARMVQFEDQIEIV